MTEKDNNSENVNESHDERMSEDSKAVSEESLDNDPESDANDVSENADEDLFDSEESDSVVEELESETQESETQESDNANEVEEKKVSAPLTDEKLKNILEAALMAMGKPMSVDQLIRLFEGEETPSAGRVKDALKLLQEECEGRGIELKEVATGYRYQSRQDYADWISRLYEEKPAKYSRAYLETLALIAYRQPVTRAEIEEVRGVSVSSYIIKTMLEREWIRVVGHRDVPGRPSLYATTKQFLDYFNMKSLDELPSLAEIKDLDELNPELALEEPNGEESSKEESSGEDPNNEASDNVESLGDESTRDESTNDESTNNVEEPIEKELESVNEFESDVVDDAIVESEVAESYVQENLQPEPEQFSAEEDNPGSRLSAFNSESSENADDEVESSRDENIVENKIGDFLNESSTSDELSEESTKSRSQEEQE